MKPSSAKAKGRLLQQTVRDAILTTFHRELEPDDVKSTSMGAQGEDVQLSPAARRIFPFAIECKSRNRIQVYRFYEQAEGHAKLGEEPLVVIKENHKQPLALVSLDYLMVLAYDAHRCTEYWIQHQKEVSKAALLQSKFKD